MVVATSNVAPGELYRDGLNRSLFLPFIALMERHMEVVELAARADFRLEKLAGQPVWHVPADAAAAAALDEAWRRLTGGQPGAEQTFRVLGRPLRVPRAARGVARFGFHELCERPLGAADYLKIAHEFHTLILDRIPVMDYDRRNEAKRFIILIDTFYDNGVKLLASAAAEPDTLVPRPGRLRGARIQAHRLPPDRDALAVLSGLAARAAGFDRQSDGARGNRGNLTGRRPRG